MRKGMPRYNYMQCETIFPVVVNTRMGSVKRTRRCRKKVFVEKICRVCYKFRVRGIR